MAHSSIALVPTSSVNGALRRRRKLLGFLGVLGLLGTAKLALAGHLLLNVTPSIPRGVYWISPSIRAHRGDLVAFPIPAPVRTLAHERQYVPTSIELLAKPVIAVGGDDVCIRDGKLFVNGAAVGKVLDVDREGRPLPRHSGCGTLPRDALFVATGHDYSFDSRYFGPIEQTGVRGTLSALLTF